MSKELETTTQPDDFQRLLYRNQTRIYAYVLSLVGNYPDADDIMQDTITVMWQKFSDFQPGSDFIAWGIKIAQFKILDYRRSKQRQKVVQYDDDILEEVISRATEAGKHFDERVEILSQCLKKQKERYFNIIKLRYFDGIDPKAIADRTGLTMSNVYKLLSRAYSQLLLCMKTTMARRGGTSLEWN